MVYLFRLVRFGWYSVVGAFLGGMGEIPPLPIRKNLFLGYGFFEVFKILHIFFIRIMSARISPHLTEQKGTIFLTVFEEIHNLFTNEGENAFEGYSVLPGHLSPFTTYAKNRGKSKPFSRRFYKIISRSFQRMRGMASVLGGSFGMPP